MTIGRSENSDEVDRRHGRSGLDADVDTLTLNAEEHGVDNAARRVAAQFEARSARREAEAARRYYQDRAAQPSGAAPFHPYRGHTDRYAPHNGPFDGSSDPYAPRRAAGRASDLEPMRQPPHMGGADAVARLRRIADGLQPGQSRRGGISYMTGAEGPKIDWAKAEAPSREDIEAIAADAYAALPKTFRDLCDGVAILVRDFAEDDVLEALGVENEFDLMGLYEGIALTEASHDDVMKDFHRIFLYRRPILDYWMEHHESLGAVITHVLVHEIGHHFGLSDADMDAIERSVG